MKVLHVDRKGSFGDIAIEGAAFCTDTSRQIRIVQIRIEALLRIHTLGLRGLFLRIYWNRYGNRCGIRKGSLANTLGLRGLFLRMHENIYGSLFGGISQKQGSLCGHIKMCHLGWIGLFCE